MRILFLSTHGLYCGISSYTKNLSDNLKKIGHETHIYEIPDKTSFQYYSKDEVKEFFDAFIAKAKEFDVVHIQHEYGLYEAGRGHIF